MTPLLFLFILDFSGSMYQKLNEQMKFLIIQQNVTALMAALPSEQQETESGLLVFGLHPKNKCNDLVYSEVRSKSVVKKVTEFHPGPYSRTPLAEAIKRGTLTTIRRGVKRVVLFSDGADSCGRNPCEELLISNEKLKAVNLIMDLTFVGIDLKSDAPKFECFKKSLSNIKINFSDIQTEFAVQTALQRENEVTVTNDIGGTFGFISVKGAPASVKFSAIRVAPKVKPHHWLGAYRTQIERGTYRLTSDYPHSKKLSVKITENQTQEIYWSDFFRQPKSMLGYELNSLTLLLTPLDQTQAAHRQVVPVIIEGALGPTLNLGQTHLPFGDWAVKILSPPWLKRTASQEIFTLAPETSLRIDVFKMFALKWQQVPDPGSRWIFELSDKQRYYLQGRIGKIPISKTDQVRWIQSSH
jgi:hypothetical protein